MLLHNYVQVKELKKKQIRDEELYFEYLKVAPIIKAQSFLKNCSVFPVSWGGQAYSFHPIFLIYFQESVQLVLFKICFPS